MEKFSNVAKNFSRSSKSYAAAGAFQKVAAKHFFGFIDREIDAKNQVGKILELGCGTGFMTIGLIQMFPEAQFVVSDISEDMLKRCMDSTLTAAGKKQSAPYFECYNITEAQIEKFYNVVISALAFQWVPQLEPVLANIKEHLLPDGKLVFSTLLQGTFSTLHQVFDELDIPYPGPKLLSKEELEAKCAVFDSCRIEVSKHVEKHDSVLAFLKQVQLTGAKNATGVPLSVSDLRRVINRYTELVGEGPISVDYEFAEVVCA